MKNFTTTKIKSLSTQIEKFKLELSVKEKELRLIQEEYKGKQEHLKRLTDELAALKQSSCELIISEHAILRYLERVYKLDLEKLSQEIVPQSLKTTIKELGNGEYHTSEGYSLKMQVYSDKERQTFVNNLSSKIILRSPDFDTAKYLSGIIGEKEVVQTSSGSSIGLKATVTEYLSINKSRRNLVYYPLSLWISTI